MLGDAIEDAHIAAAAKYLLSGSPNPEHAFMCTKLDGGRVLVMQLVLGNGVVDTTCRTNTLVLTPDETYATKVKPVIQGKRTVTRMGNPQKFAGERGAEIKSKHRYWPTQLLCTVLNSVQPTGVCAGAKRIAIPAYLRA